MKWYHIYKTQTGLTPVIDDDKHFIHQLLSHGQVLSIDEVWYQMTIINVQANDYGIYICEGTNRLGTDRVEIKIYGLLCILSVVSLQVCPAAAALIPTTYTGCANNYGHSAFYRISRKLPKIMP